MCKFWKQFCVKILGHQQFLKYSNQLAWNQKPDQQIKLLKKKNSTNHPVIYNASSYIILELCWLRYKEAYNENLINPPSVNTCIHYRDLPNLPGVSIIVLWLNSLCFIVHFLSSAVFSPSAGPWLQSHTQIVLSRRKVGIVAGTCTWSTVPMPSPEPESWKCTLLRISYKCP